MTHNCTPTCPQWCDPRHCRLEQRDLHHRSTATALDVTDTTWAVQLHRVDELSFPGCQGSPEIEVTVTDAFTDTPDLRFCLPVEDISRLTEFLTELYYRARFHGSPVTSELYAGDAA